MNSIEYQFWAVEIDLAPLPESIQDEMYETCNDVNVSCGEIGRATLRVQPKEGQYIARFSGRKADLIRFIEHYNQIADLDIKYLEWIYIPLCEIVLGVELPAEDEDWIPGDDRSYLCMHATFEINNSRTNLLERLLDHPAKQYSTFDEFDAVTNIMIVFEDANQVQEFFRDHLAELLETPILAA